MICLSSSNMFSNTSTTALLSFFRKRLDKSVYPLKLLPGIVSKHRGTWWSVYASTVFLDICDVLQTVIKPAIIQIAKQVIQIHKDFSSCIEASDILVLQSILMQYGVIVDFGSNERISSSASGIVRIFFSDIWLSPFPGSHYRSIKCKSPDEMRIVSN